MKIGFSLGRCVRDIVNEKISIDDVAFIVAATSIDSVQQLDRVIEYYCGEPNYLLDCDLEKSKEIAHQLWDRNKILQPRRQGLQRHAQPENSIWVDIFPTELSENESVKRSWDAYRFMIHMIENVDHEATEIFR